MASRVPLIATTLAVAAGVWMLQRWSTGPKRRMRAAMQADACDPFRHWVHGVMGIVSRDQDYAHLPRDEARAMLVGWFEVYDADEHERAVQRMSHPQADATWNLVRCVVLIRLGVAAGFVSMSTSWELLRPVCLTLQHAHGSWPELGLAYVAARRRWRDLAHDGSQDDHGMTTIIDNVAWLETTAWPEIPYHTDLEAES